MIDLETKIEKNLKNIMAQVFQVPIESIESNASVRTIASWKGIKHLELIEALESEFKIKFEDSEKETLISYKVIKATIRAYLD